LDQPEPMLPPVAVVQLVETVQKVGHRLQIQLQMKTWRVEPTSHEYLNHLFPTRSSQPF
jgi:hypothetical protein